METLCSLLYLVAGVLFILAIKGLASPASARRGNMLGMLGMTLAIGATLFLPGIHHEWLMLSILAAGGLVGTMIALKINMTALPQLVAGFHSLVGLAAVLVACAAYLNPVAFGLLGEHGIHLNSRIEMGLGLAIGAITFSGSIIAFLKLQGIMGGAPVRFIGQHLLNALIGIAIVLSLVFWVGQESQHAFMSLLALSFLIGFLLIIPIGGADMPVVISMLNSYSGWAAAGIGFTLSNHLLIITGALVGSSGAILSYIMCVGMNRSLFNVIFGGFAQSGSADVTNSAQDNTNKQVQQANGEDAAFLLANAKDVIIVPGYGMAVAHAQHAVKELTDALIAKGVRVRFAIHPVAGRMPGHMNVLLAEANIPYDLVFEQDEINRDFGQCDVVYVIGANDITNPAAKNDAKSPIYGMPILEVDKARNILFVKRGLATGYAGVDNALFYMDNTHMLFGDAKAMTESVTKALQHM